MTYRLPSLNALRAFEAAARHLSFKTAASELGVTPGAVSQQVKKLEASLGVALFRRLPHGLLLTSRGEAYLPKISKIFEDLTDATESIAPEINGRKFKLGICPKAQALLPAHWPTRQPGLKAHVRDWVETNDLALVVNNEIDCLIRLDCGPSGELCQVPVQTQTAPLQFICKPGLADCRQSKAILEALAALA